MVPARREIGSKRGTGILPQLPEPCQAQAALLPATSLGTGGRGWRGAADAWQPFPGTVCPSRHHGSAAKSQMGRRKRGKRQRQELASSCPVVGDALGAPSLRHSQLGDILVPWQSLVMVPVSHGEVQPHLSPLVPQVQPGEPILEMASMDQPGWAMLRGERGSGRHTSYPASVCHTGGLGKLGRGEWRRDF